MRARSSRRAALLEAYARSEIAPELPTDFSFITQETTLQMVMERAGPASRVTRLLVKRDAAAEKTAEPNITAVEYDLPDRGAVIVLPEAPGEPQSRIRAVLYRRPRGVEQI